jgi:hypothetical protein
MILGLFPFGFVSALALSMCPLFSSVEELQRFLAESVLHTYHCFSMGAPCQLEQLHSFKCLSNILRYRNQNCCARQMGVQDISTYTSTAECIPKYLQESLLYLPDIPNLITYSKPFQVYQCFDMKSGLEQGLGRVFASCSFHAMLGRRLQMNSQRIQALSNNRFTANHRCSGQSEAARRQETEHHESLICSITLA